MPVGGSGPSNALELWVRETAPRAIAYARSLLRNSLDAEDLVQDCYCRLLAKADVYDLPRDGMKLLLTAITNATINLRTRRKPLFRLVRESADGTEHLDDPADHQSPAPDQMAMHSELSTAVAEGLARLPPSQRAAVELKSLGYSQQEIADILQVSPTNAGVLIHRGRLALAKYLTPFLNGEDQP